MNNQIPGIDFNIENNYNVYHYKNNSNLDYFPQINNPVINNVINPIINNNEIKYHNITVQTDFNNNNNYIYSNYIFQNQINNKNVNNNNIILNNNYNSSRNFDYKYNYNQTQNNINIQNNYIDNFLFTQKKELNRNNSQSSYSTANRTNNNKNDNFNRTFKNQEYLNSNKINFNNTLSQSPDFRNKKYSNSNGKTINRNGKTIGNIDMNIQSQGQTLNNSHLVSNFSNRNCKVKQNNGISPIDSKYFTKYKWNKFK